MKLLREKKSYITIAMAVIFALVMQMAVLSMGVSAMSDSATETIDQTENGTESDTEGNTENNTETTETPISGENETTTDEAVMPSQEEMTTPAATKPAEAGIAITEIVFEKEYTEVGEFRLTNGNVTVNYTMQTGNIPVQEIYYVWEEEPDSHMPVEIVENRGSFVVESEGKGAIQLVCVDTEGNVITSEEKGIWIDKTSPVITMGGNSDTITIMPPSILKAEVSDGENGSGITDFAYRLDEGELITVSGTDFELNFEEDSSGEHTITVIATDKAGNISRITKKIVVRVAPIITVTVPTDIELIILSRPIKDGVNIFSYDWEVINKSNVPIHATISNYSMNSDFTGDFEESYLNLKMKYCSQETDIPLGFMPRTNLYEFILDKAEYSSQKEYISSGEGAKASFSYCGFAAHEFNEFLRYNKAVFHMAFVFEPVLEDTEQ